MTVSGGPVERGDVLSMVDDTVETMDISRIKVDPKLRLNRYDADHVRRLSQAETELPPVIVDRRSKAVVDGLHRISAARARGRQQVRVRYFDGTPAEACLLWLELNAYDGLPLSLGERKAAAAVLLQHYAWWSDRAIGRACGLSGKTVGGVRSRSNKTIPPSNTRVGLDGRARKVDSAAARKLVAALCAEDPELSLRELSRRSGLSVGAVRNVREQVQAHPAGDGQGEPRAVGDGDAVSLAEQLNRLRRDPAMVCTESGRRTIRWLDAVLSRRVGMALVREVPPHCGPAVAAIASACADDLREFAEALNHRSRSS